MIAELVAINAYHCQIGELAAGNPGRFVVNMDEPGFADFAGAKLEAIPFPSDRRMKQSTMVAGNAADGTALMRLMVVLCLTIEKELSLGLSFAERSTSVPKEHVCDRTTVGRHTVHASTAAYASRFKGFVGTLKNPRLH